MLPVMPGSEGATVDVPGYSKCSTTGRSALVSISNRVLVRLMCSTKPCSVSCSFAEFAGTEPDHRTVIFFQIVTFFGVG